MKNLRERDLRQKYEEMENRFVQRVYQKAASQKNRSKAKHVEIEILRQQETPRHTPKFSAELSVSRVLSKIIGANFNMMSLYSTYFLRHPVFTFKYSPILNV